MGLRYSLLFIFSILILSHCSKKSSCDSFPDVSEIEVNVEIERLDQELFSADSKAEVLEFIANNSQFAEAFLSRRDYPNDSTLAEDLFKLIKDPFIDTLYSEVQREFKELSWLAEEMNRSFKLLIHYFPDFEVPQVQVGVSGLSQDLFVSDSLVIIGLDFFLGPGATYRPIGQPQYILKRYQKEYIAPSIILLMTNALVATDYKDESMIADMIFYGKSFFVSEKVLPCTPDSIFLAYSAQEIADIDVNESIIWANVIENELLYETNHIIKQKFLGERPKTLEISPRCPGRIGRWVGWRIIQSYMENHENVSIESLLKNHNAQAIFQESGYRPG